MSDRLTVPSRVGLTPGPAIGAPSVSRAAQRIPSQEACRTLSPSLQAKSAPVRACSASDVSTYSEQPAWAPAPSTSTFPYDVDVADTLAGPLGALVVASAHDGAAALTGALSCGTAAISPRLSTAVVPSPATIRFGRRNVMTPP